MVKTVDIGCGIKYPKVTFAATSKRHKSLTAELIKSLDEHRAEMLRNFPRKHLFLRFSGKTDDGYSVFSNKYGYEKHIKCEMVNGKETFYMRGYTDGEQTGSGTFIVQSKATKEYYANL